MFIAQSERTVVGESLVVILAVATLLTASCNKNQYQSSSSHQQTSNGGSQTQTPRNRKTLESKSKAASAVTTPADNKFFAARQRMVIDQLADRDIVDRSVLDAMKKVPRHEFVPVAMRRRAYDDSPLPIGNGQTISQPYIVALMTQLVRPQPHQKALDVGTGSGYQAAVLAELVENVYSIEIIESLASDAQDRLQRLGYKNITVRHGDGYRGWQSESPFDMIVVAAAPDHVPKPLLDQLAVGGRMILPVGDRYQQLIVIEKKEDGTMVQEEVAPVVFVPMTGEARR